GGGGDCVFGIAGATGAESVGGFGATAGTDSFFISAAGGGTETGGDSTRAEGRFAVLSGSTGRGFSSPRVRANPRRTTSPIAARDPTTTARADLRGRTTAIRRVDWPTFGIRDVDPFRRT